MLPKKEYLKELCSTRWVERHDAILVFVELFHPIIASLEEISEWDDRNSSSDANTLCYDQNF